MKYISLGIELTDELGVKSVSINWNDTDLPSDARLIELLSIALLKSIYSNKEFIELQDILSERGIQFNS